MLSVRGAWAGPIHRQHPRLSRNYGSKWPDEPLDTSCLREGQDVLGSVFTQVAAVCGVHTAGAAEPCGSEGRGGAEAAAPG